MNDGTEELLNEKESDTVVSKCTGCGAVLDYDIESGNLKCSHCGTVKLIDGDTGVQRREITADVLGQHADWKGTVVSRCDNCGARIVFDKNEIARICSFCASTNIVVTEELPGIKPDSVIPFQVTKDGAAERFENWIKKRFWAPGSLKQADIRERMNALYSSSWAFSSKTQSNYNGTLGRTTTERTSDGKFRTKTNWFRVSGQMFMDYFDYTYQSGAQISPAMFGKIKPFDLKLLKVYRQEYLSGIAAEHYTRSLDMCFNDFTNFVRADIRRKIMQKHHADSVRVLNVNTDYRDKKFNYILLPVYISNYEYKAKTYKFYVNGADGKVVGEYPKSKLKITMLILGIAAAVAVGVTLWFFLGR